MQQVDVAAALLLGHTVGAAELLASGIPLFLVICAAVRGAVLPARERITERHFEKRQNRFSR